MVEGVGGAAIAVVRVATIDVFAQLLIKVELGDDEGFIINRNFEVEVGGAAWVPAGVDAVEGELALVVAGLAAA